MTPPDLHIRQAALDTQQSFIVQAPAGSGKTELLVQRFLALLSTAERAPEEIIAITFTKKAASEMRHRILHALHMAQGPAPDEPHARKTWELGVAALQRNQALAWNLLENPNRLRVQTIDSLCASIANKTPLLSGISTANCLSEEEAEQCYLNAARQLLSVLEDASPLSTHIASLLLHLDNRVELVENLLVRMLKRRDQWLPHLVTHGRSLSSDAFRKKLEAGLSHAVAEILENCEQALPSTLRNELLVLMRFSAENLNNPLLSTLEIFPPATPEKQQEWCFLANMLLTQEGAWRKTVDKRTGFPAEDKTMKQRMMDVLNTLRDDDILHQHLSELLNAPSVTYTEHQWKIIAALSELLPLLVAELKIIFKENNAADFSEVAMAANQALGDIDSPTDLTLILDAKIRHLLIDEFQDTSTAQFHLLEKLTAGWQADDGRTLFLVGDPMQSIYRFREAEVGLFLKAQQEGLGNITLNVLTLTSNFRSTPEIIEWINHQFITVFPAQSDISAGAISFSPSEATKSADSTSGVFLETFLPEKNHDWIKNTVTLIQQKQLQSPNESIAILVRSRAHLKSIIPELKKANLQFTAVEIDRLHNQSIVQDLLSLTGALLHMGDRLSWLSLLRAPWCGLTLHDLHAICLKQPKKPLWEVLCAFTEITALSEDGRTRLSTVIPILKKSLANRYRLPLRTWIEETWQALNGPACIEDPAKLASAEAYFKLLTTFDQSGEIPDMEKLQKVVQSKYSAPPSSANCNVHIMTIHKAKGLEFDTVILPCLELKNRHEEDQLLLWLDRTRAHYESDLILAPIKARDQKSDPIYAWLRAVEKTKAQYELTRLLYVAATRAKKNLHLMATLSLKDEALKEPDSGSFLELLWGAFQSVAQKKLLQSTSSAEVLAPQTTQTPTFKRLKISTFKPQTDALTTEKIAPTTHNIPRQLTDHTAQHIGTVTHKALEQISQEGWESWSAKKIEKEKPRWKLWLMQAGIAQYALEDGLIQVCTAIQNTLSDARGQWILSAHTQHQSEFALTTLIDDIPTHVMIDRTFIDEHQTRWIIDYKTGKPSEDEDKNSFLARAKSMHTVQLEKYADIMRQYDPRPIRLGIYFPAFGGWCEWAINEKNKIAL